MKIRKIAIKNFRGIKELEWSLPSAEVFCLIGKGDSSKSTILEAIRFAFHPQWNVAFNDSDFYNCKFDESIVIEVTLGDLVAEFCSLTKYGQHLRGWDGAAQKLMDEPVDLEEVMTVRLTVGKELEPKWVVFTDRTPDGVPFKPADRNKVAVGMIGAYSEKQLSWANGTALAKLTEAQSLNELLATASRTAKTSLDAGRAITLKNFDAAATKSQEIAKLLGVPVTNGYKAHLDLASVNLKVGGLALHDGEIPLRQFGLGSRRMLLCGIQKVGLDEGHITLFDEVEFGLEPHRISRLLKHVREDKKGQYFLTTHSPVVLRELTVKDLYIVHSRNGVVQILPAFSESLNEHEAQGKMRSSAEAFLAKKVVVCEGATEVGFLRGFDDYKVGKNRDPLSFHGVSLLDAKGGSQVKNLAKAFKTLCYEVSVVADADADDQFSPADIAELRALNIPVIVWNDKLSIEQRAFADLHWSKVQASLKLAGEELNCPAHDHVQSRYGEALSKDVATWIDSEKLRTVIGLAAKKGSWFKDTTKGDLWFKTVASSFDEEGFKKKDIAVKMEQFWTWVEHV